MIPYTIMLSAGGGHVPPPVIDVDGTLFVQLGIFLVLFVIMRKFVFLPYLEARHERDANIDGAKQRAEATGAQTCDKMERYERRLTEARREAATGRGLMRAEGESKAQTLLGAARSEAEATLQQARTKIATSVPAAELALRTRADELARVVATKVLGRAL